MPPPSMHGLTRSLRPVAYRALGRRESAARIRLGVTLLLGVAVAIQMSAIVARLARAFERSQAQHYDTPPRPEAAPRVAQRNERLAQRIIAAHLFGAPPVQATTAGPVPQDLKLELSLVGTLAEPNPEKGFAIIRLSSQRTDLFAAHAQIDAATRLVRVFTDHVVVEWRGSERVLVLPRQGGNAPVLASTELPLPVATDDEPEEEVRGTGVKPMHEGNYRTILDNIDYNPRMVGDKVNGIEIVSVKDEEKLERIGLHEGDVVTYVNGELINGPGRIDELLKALSDGKTVTATIIRDGQPSSELLQGNP